MHETLSADLEDSMERSSVSGMEAAMEGLDSFYRDCKQETVKSIESHREEIAAFPVS